ncbi:MAG: tyrosine-protein phosphatase [Anaerolineae bacterium]|nr:tyrosine-protein phosphatase [Anaerolineae bacterium]
MSNLTHLPFETPGQIYRSGMPFSYFDIGYTLLEEYRQAGINTVVMLVSDEEARMKSGRDLRAAYQHRGMQVIQLAIEDFDIPRDEPALQAALQSAAQQASLGSNLVVHCLAGLGRTGLFLGLLARSILGFPGEEAVAWVRRWVDGAVQTDAQKKFVIDFKID